MAPMQWVMVPCGLQTGEKQKGSVSLSRVTMQARGGSGTLVAFAFLLWEELSDTTGQNPSLHALCGVSQQAAEPQRNSGGLAKKPKTRCPERAPIKASRHCEEDWGLFAHSQLPPMQHCRGSGCRHAFLTLFTW